MGERAKGGNTRSRERKGKRDRRVKLGPARGSKTHRNFGFRIQFRVSDPFSFPHLISHSLWKFFYTMLFNPESLYHKLWLKHDVCFYSKRYGVCYSFLKLECMDWGRIAEVGKLIFHFRCLFGARGKWENLFPFSLFSFPFYTSFLHNYFPAFRVLQLILWSYKSHL